MDLVGNVGADEGAGVGAVLDKIFGAVVTMFVHAVTGGGVVPGKSRFDAVLSNCSAAPNLVDFVVLLFKSILMSIFVDDLIVLVVFAANNPMYPM